MNIYDHFKCDKCKKAYKGRFTFTQEGNVECYNCDSIEEVGEIQWGNIHDEASIGVQLLRATMQEMLLEDVERIYKSESVRGEDYTEIFFKDDGTMDVDKLYYQYNPLDIIIEGQQKAYSALRYLEGTDTEYMVIAEKVIDVYKNFREKKLTVQEIKAVWDLYLTAEVKMMIRSGES